MPKMVVEKGYFETKDEVLEDIRKSGFWPHTYVSDAFPELPLHYHDHDIIGYLLEGEGYVLDEDGEHVPLAPGDRLDIPKGAWHAEGEVTQRMVYIVSLRDPIALMEGLFPKEPKGPFPSLD